MIKSFGSKETELIWEGKISSEYIFMAKLKNVHPGEVLLQEFLIPMGITAYRLSIEIGIPQTRISEIVKGKRRISADTAIRLSNYFGNSTKFWLGLQNDFDIEEEIKKKAPEFRAIRKHKINAA
jgi:addiction module HigA family antidote